MRHYLLLVVLLVTSQLAYAQATAPATRLDSLLALPVAATVPPIGTDTVAALHRLFAARREERNVLVAGTILTLGLYAVINQQAAGPSITRDINSLVSLLIISPLVLLEYVHGARYSHKKEQQAIAALAAHQLPNSVKAQLQVKFFRSPSSKVIR
jgi:hypothetical protein